MKQACAMLKKQSATRRNRNKDDLLPQRFATAHPVLPARVSATTQTNRTRLDHAIAHVSALIISTTKLRRVDSFIEPVFSFKRRSK
jgi:hypothetical protein